MVLYIDMNEEKKNYRNIFVNLLIPYSILIILLFVMGLLFYFQSVKISEDQIKQRNEFLLQEVKESLSSFLSDSDKLFSYLTYVSSSFDLTTDNNEMDLNELSAELFNLDVSKKLIPSTLIHDYIQEYYILLESPKVIINNDLSLSLETYLNNGFIFEDNDIEEIVKIANNRLYTGENFTEMLSLMPTANETFIHYKMALIKSFKSLFGGLRGNIIIYIDKNSLLKTLEKIDISYGGGVFVLSNDNSIDFGIAEGEYFETILKNNQLTSSEIDDLSLNPHWLITEINIPGSPFRYISVQSINYLKEKTKKTRQLLISMISLLIVSGVSLSLIFVSMNTRQANQLFLEFKRRKIFGEESSKKTNLLGNIFSSLNFQMHKLSDNISEQTRHLEKNIIEKLLYGYHITKQDRIEIIGSHIKEDADSYTVILINMRTDNSNSYADNIEKEALWRSQIKVLVEEIVHEKDICIFDRDPLEMILIYQEFSHIDEGISSFVESMSSYICSNEYLNTKITVGQSVPSIEEISHSFEKAILVKDSYKEKENSDVLWYLGKDTSSMDLYIPVDFERKVINSIMAGDCITLDKIFNELAQKNFKENRISFHLIQILLNSVSSILISISQRSITDNAEIFSMVNDIITDEITLKNYEIFYKKLHDLAFRMALSRSEIQNDPKGKLVQGLCDYIDNNFKNPQLSADLVASELGISSNYVFKLFKEYYGTSFQKHVEHLRMNDAKRLLKDEPEKSIKEIAYESGYSSMNTFYRAFKKNFGISASNYRNSLNNR